MTRLLSAALTMRTCAASAAGIYANETGWWHDGCDQIFEMYDGTYCEGGDVACMMPRIFDRTSCRMPGSIRQSLLAGAIWHGIASRPDSTGLVYRRTLKEVKDNAFEIKRMKIV